ncbi:spore coat protein [Alkalihalophilus marmarensis]|jgi:similar to spore coat protein|uniref:Spore coat protein GerQ n=1 Tax=Alkalihalophilus marmarensis DSM 21297 TaxID=1188261 RepID=U6SR56_9BACI|nr:spore coat protein [Alkalihalophilus marmarensis]ERN54108.1 spore coat protein GerQ [Alkalihalophilus marmarensis DSM 21297]MCM3488469.1 spore coat protein [Alkalihalophilus marmarensis]
MSSILDKINNKDLINDEVIATDLLVTAKAAVRSYAVAITETASPEIHNILKKQLDETIQLHHEVATYMIEQEMYHAYDIDEQVSHDLEKAKIALEMPTSK